MAGGVENKKELTQKKMNEKASKLPAAVGRIFLTSLSSVNFNVFFAVCCFFFFCLVLMPLTVKYRSVFIPLRVAIQLGFPRWQLLMLTLRIMQAS